MAAGYALIGLALVAQTGGAGGGRHLLTVGALGLNVFVVICIAGRMHCGRGLDERAWVPAGALLLVAAALARAIAGWADTHTALWIGAASLAWIAAFALCLAYLGPLFVTGRQDGQEGCAGPA